MRLKRNRLKIFVGMALLAIPGLGEKSAISIEESLEAFLSEPMFDVNQIFHDERFPNVVVALDGSVIATWGSQTVHARRSEDGGKSWGEEIEISSGIHSGGIIGRYSCLSRR